MGPCLIQFLIENYNAKDECLRFDRGRKIYISYDNVENIMGLTKACDHLVEPNESITERDLPNGFQYSYGRNGFRINTLVTEMVAYDMIGFY
jgi:hypothetical protein